jgi:hypothetical protein
VATWVVELVAAVLDVVEDVVLDELVDGLLGVVCDEVEELEFDEVLAALGVVTVIGFSTTDTFG